MVAETRKKSEKDEAVDKLSKMYANALTAGSVGVLEIFITHAPLLKIVPLGRRTDQDNELVKSALSSLSHEELNDLFRALVVKHIKNMAAQEAQALRRVEYIG